MAKNIKTISVAKTKRDLRAKELLKEFFQILEVQKQVEVRLQEIKEALEKEYAKVDFESLILECYKINRVSKDVPKFDTKAFKEDYAKLYQQYSTVSHLNYLTIGMVHENTRVAK